MISNSNSTRRQRKSPLPALLMVVVFSILSCSLPGVNNVAGTSGGLSMSRLTSTPIVSAFEPDIIQNTNVRSVVVTSVVIPTESVPVSTPSVSGKTWYHIVEQGESLYTIAETECGDARQYVWLQWLNGKMDSEVLEVGEIVTVNCQ